MKNQLDWSALRAGGLVALVFAVPFSIAARWLADTNAKSPWIVWLTLAAVAGFVLGAGVAAWVQQLRLPLAHGIVCAVGTYAVAQAVFIIVRLALGRHVHWFAAFFNLTVVLGAGLVGGGLGSSLRKRGLTPGTLPRAGRQAGQEDEP